MATKQSLQVAVDAAMLEQVERLRLALEVAQHWLALLHGAQVVDRAGSGKPLPLDLAAPLAQIDLALAGAGPAVEASHWMPAGGGTLDRATFDKARRVMEAQQASEDAPAVDLDAVAAAGYATCYHDVGKVPPFGEASKDVQARWRVIACAVLMAANIETLPKSGDVEMCPWCGYAVWVSAHGDGVCNRTDGVKPRGITYEGALPPVSGTAPQMQLYLWYPELLRESTEGGALVLAASEDEARELVYAALAPMTESVVKRQHLRHEDLAAHAEIVEPGRVVTFQGAG